MHPDETAAPPPAPSAPAPALAPDAADAADAADAGATTPPAEAALPAAADDAAAAPAAAASASSEPGLSPAECGARLAELFPVLFVAPGAPGPFKPIKLRIHADIAARAPGVFTKRVLGIFFSRYTTSGAYLKALTAPDAQRFDLDGQPAGEIAEEHRAAALEELARRHAIAAERRAAQRKTMAPMAVSTPEGAPQPPQPPRPPRREHDGAHGERRPPRPPHNESRQQRPGRGPAIGRNATRRATGRNATPRPQRIARRLQRPRPRRCCRSILHSASARCCCARSSPVR